MIAMDLTNHLAAHFEDNIAATRRSMGSVAEQPRRRNPGAATVHLRAALLSEW